MNKERGKAESNHNLRLIFVQDLESGASKIHVDGGTIDLAPEEFIAAYKLKEGDSLKLSQGKEVARKPYYLRRISEYCTRVTVFRNKKEAFNFTVSNERISPNLLKRITT